MRISKSTYSTGNVLIRHTLLAFYFVVVFPPLIQLFLLNPFQSKFGRKKQIWKMNCFWITDSRCLLCLLPNNFNSKGCVKKEGVHNFENTHHLHWYDLDVVEMRISTTLGFTSKSTWKYTRV